MPVRRTLPLFKGFDKNGPFTSYHRHLPHWRQPGATYFVTFRLVDSIPQSVLTYLQKLRREIELQQNHPRAKSLNEEYERAVFQKMEGTLDEGHGACMLRDPENVKIVRKHLAHGQGTQHFMGCGVVMPNHCHIVIRPFDGYDLETVVGQAKAFAAKWINRRLGTTGQLWQEESYDRIIRDEEHLYRIIQYIGRNPAKCGISDLDVLRWVHLEWVDAGWNFEDLVTPPSATG